MGPEIVSVRMCGPLTRIRIVELAGLGPAPFAAMHSDMGATTRHQQNRPPWGGVAGTATATADGSVARVAVFTSPSRA